MAKLLKLRRGTTTQHASFTGAEGEVTIDVDKDVPVVHDGSTQGGHPVAAEDMANVSSANIAGRLANDSLATSKLAAGALPSDVTVASANLVDGTIVNADVNASAAIAGTKVAPAFGSQNLSTSGTAATGALTVTGNIGVSGTVDGRDVAADGTKLDGIETAATADQTAAEIRTLVENASDSNVFTDADHTKLNGIETAATADQTASEILTLIKTVDGSGSGLDADALDGLDSTAFLRSNAGDQADGDITFNGGAGAVTVAAASDIRLLDGTWTGDNTPAKIQGNSNSLYLVYPDAGGCYIRDSAGNNNFTVDSSGNCTALGNVTAYSDERLKTDVNTINDALSICGKLRGVSYKWIRDDKPSIGVIAQEVEKVIPEVVLTSHDVDPSTGEVGEIKSVDYGKIVGVLINAINELKAEVDELKGGK